VKRVQTKIVKGSPHLLLASTKSIGYASDTSSCSVLKNYQDIVFHNISNYFIIFHIYLQKFLKVI
jgi:hypothetical protein